MIDYKLFYDIATYGSKAWKGSFSPKEIACNAYAYLCDFNHAKETETINTTIQNLYELLIEDGSEQCLDWAYTLATELGLIDMDYLDYMETDTELIKTFLERR